MLQYSAQLSAELWEWAPPSCNAAEELQPRSFVFLRQEMAMNCGCREREREKHKTLPPAHVHKTSQSSPKSIFSLPSPPCWSCLHGTLPSRGEVAALSCCHFGNIVLDWTCCGLGEMKEFDIKSQKVKHKQVLFQELFPCVFFQRDFL